MSFVYIDPIQLEQQHTITCQRIHQSLCSKSGPYKIRSPDEIIAITKLGSRLWGTFTMKSDFDCLVIHRAPESNKAVRHVGVSISSSSSSSSSSDKIDLRLESVESFIEQMKLGSSRCWLAFLLMVSEVTKKKDKKGNSSHVNDDDDHGDDDAQDQDEEDPLKDYSSLLSYNSDQLPSFISKVISNVKSLDVKVLIGKLFETLKDDEQRVVKMMFVADQKEHGLKIMKHSLRLVFSSLLILDAMKPKKDNDNDNDNDGDDDDNNNKNKNRKTAAKKKHSQTSNDNKKNKNASTMMLQIFNAFRPCIDLRKDVFGIEEKVMNILDKLSSSSTSELLLTEKDIHDFYNEETILANYFQGII